MNQSPKPFSPKEYSLQLVDFYLLTPKAFAIVEEKKAPDFKKLNYQSEPTYSYYEINSKGQIPEPHQKNQSFLDQFASLIKELNNLIIFFHKASQSSILLEKNNDCVADEQQKIVNGFHKKIEAGTMLSEDKNSQQALYAYFKHQLEQAVILLLDKKSALEKLPKAQRQEIQSEIISNLMMLCQGLSVCSEGNKSALNDIVRNLAPSHDLVFLRQRFRHAGVKESAVFAVNELNLGTFNLHADTIFLKRLSEEEDLGIVNATSGTISEFESYQSEQKLRDYANTHGRKMLAERYNFETICEHLADNQYQQVRLILNKYQYPKTLNITQKNEWLSATAFLLEAKICREQDLFVQIDEDTSRIHPYFSLQLPYYLRRWSLQTQLNDGIFYSIADLLYNYKFALSRLQWIKSSEDVNTCRLIEPNQPWQTFLTEPLTHKGVYRFVATLEYTGCDPNLKNELGESPLLLALKLGSPMPSELQFFAVNTLLQLPHPSQPSPAKNLFSCTAYWCDLTYRDPQGHSLLALASMETCGFESFELLLKHFEHISLMKAVEEVFTLLENRNLEEMKQEAEEDNEEDSSSEILKKHITEKLAITHLLTMTLFDEIREDISDSETIEIKQQQEIYSKLDLITAKGRSHQAEWIHPNKEPHQALYYAVADFNLRKVLKLLEIPGWNLKDIEDLVVQQFRESKEEKKNTNKAKKIYNSKNIAHRIVFQLMQLLLTLSHGMQEESFKLYQEIIQSLSIIAANSSTNSKLQLIKILKSQLNDHLFMVFFQEVQPKDLEEVLLIQEYLQRLPEPASLDEKGKYSQKDKKENSYLTQAIRGIQEKKYSIRTVKKLVDHHLVIYPEHLVEGLNLIFHLFFNNNNDNLLVLTNILLSKVPKEERFYFQLLRSMSRDRITTMPMLEKLANHFSTVFLTKDEVNFLLSYFLTFSNEENDKNLLFLLKQSSFNRNLNFQDQSLKERLESKKILKYYFNLIEYLLKQDIQEDSIDFIFPNLHDVFAENLLSTPNFHQRAVRINREQKAETKIKFLIKPSEEKIVPPDLKPFLLKHYEQTLEIIRIFTPPKSKARSKWLALFANQVLDLKFLIQSIAISNDIFIDVTQPRILLIGNSMLDNRLPLLVAIELMDEQLVTNLLTKLVQCDYSHEIIALTLYIIITAGHEIFSSAENITEQQIKFSAILLGANQDQVKKIILNPIGELVGKFINLITPGNRCQNLLTLMIDHLSICSPLVFNNSWDDLQRCYETSSNSQDHDGEPIPELISALVDRPFLEQNSLSENILCQYNNSDHNIKYKATDIIRFLLSQLKFIDNIVFPTLDEKETQQKARTETPLARLIEAIQEANWDQAYVFFLHLISYPSNYFYEPTAHQAKVDPKLIALEQQFTGLSTINLLSEFTGIVSRQRPEKIDDLILWLTKAEKRSRALIQVTHFEPQTLFQFETSKTFLETSGSEIVVSVHPKLSSPSHEQKTRTNSLSLHLNTISLLLEALYAHFTHLKLSPKEISQVLKPLTKTIITDLCQEYWDEDSWLKLFQFIILLFRGMPELNLYPLLRIYFSKIDEFKYFLDDHGAVLKSKIIALCVQHQTTQPIFWKSLCRHAAKKLDMDLIRILPPESDYRIWLKDDDVQPHPLFLIAESESEVKALPAIEYFLASPPKTWELASEEKTMDRQMIADFKARGLLDHTNTSLLTLFIEKNWMLSALKVLSTVRRIYPDNKNAREKYLTLKKQGRDAYFAFIEKIDQGTWSVEANNTYLELLLLKPLTDLDIRMGKNIISKEFPIPYALNMFISYFRETTNSEFIPSPRSFKYVIEQFLAASFSYEQALKLIDLVQFYHYQNPTSLPTLHRNYFLTDLLIQEARESKEDLSQNLVITKIIQVIEIETHLTSPSKKPYVYIHGNERLQHCDLVSFTILNSNPKLLNLSLGRSCKEAETKSLDFQPADKEEWIEAVFLANSEVQVEMIAIFHRFQKNSFTLKQSQLIISKALAHRELNLSAFLGILDILLKNFLEEPPESKELTKTKSNRVLELLDFTLATKHNFKTLPSNLLTGWKLAVHNSLQLMENGRKDRSHIEPDFIYKLSDKKELLQIFILLKEISSPQEFQKLINILWKRELERLNSIELFGFFSNRDTQAELLTQLFNYTEEAKKTDLLNDNFLIFMASPKCSKVTFERILHWKLPDEKENKFTTPQTFVKIHGGLILHHLIPNISDQNEEWYKLKFLITLPGVQKNQEVNGQTAIERAAANKNSVAMDLFLDQVDICYYECNKFFTDCSSVDLKLICNILIYLLENSKAKFIYGNEELKIEFNDHQFPPLILPKGLIWVDFYRQLSKDPFNKFSSLLKPDILSKISEWSVYIPPLQNTPPPDNGYNEVKRHELLSKEINYDKKERDSRPSGSLRPSKPITIQIYSCYDEIDKYIRQATNPYYSCFANFFKSSSAQSKQCTLDSLQKRLTLIKPLLSIDRYFSLMITIINKINYPQDKNFLGSDGLLEQLANAYQTGELKTDHYRFLLERFAKTFHPTIESKENKTHSENYSQPTKNIKNLIIGFSKYVAMQFDDFSPPGLLRSSNHRYYALDSKRNVGREVRRNQKPLGILTFPKNLNSLATLRDHIRGRLESKWSGLTRSKMTQDFYDIIMFLTDENIPKTEKMVTAITNSYLARYQTLQLNPAPNYK